MFFMHEGKLSTGIFWPEIHRTRLTVSNRRKLTGTSVPGAGFFSSLVVGRIGDLTKGIDPVYPSFDPN
jgi:hypothetical protein